jgi:hypothetical protein
MIIKKIVYKKSRILIKINKIIYMYFNLNNHLKESVESLNLIIKNNIKIYKKMKNSKKYKIKSNKNRTVK